MRFRRRTLQRAPLADAGPSMAPVAAGNPASQQPPSAETPGIGHVGAGTGLAFCTGVQALLLNGALSGDEGLAPIEAEISAMLTARGWSVERVHLRDVFVANCKGCFNCWVKTPGVCGTRDGAGAITQSLARSDLAVFLSPVTFGGYSSELKKVLDRSIGLVSPFFMRIGGEVHHRPRYARYPALLAVGVTADLDPEEGHIFARLVARNAVNLHAPASSAVVVSRDDSPDRIRQAVARGLAQVTARRGVA